MVYTVSRQSVTVPRSGASAITCRVSATGTRTSGISGSRKKRENRSRSRAPNSQAGAARMHSPRDGSEISAQPIARARSAASVSRAPEGTGTPSRSEKADGRSQVSPAR